MEKTQPTRARYNTKQKGNLGGKIAVVLVVILLLCGGYVLVKTYTKSNSTPVTASSHGFESHSPKELIFDIDVTRKDPSQAAYCIVTALDYDKTEVGRREVLIPPGKAQTVKVSVPIATRAQAVAGTIYGCGDNVPDYLTQSVQG